MSSSSADMLILISYISLLSFDFITQTIYKRKFQRSFKLAENVPSFYLFFYFFKHLIQASIEIFIMLNLEIYAYTEFHLFFYLVKYDLYELLKALIILISSLYFFDMFLVICIFDFWANKIRNFYVSSEDQTIKILLLFWAFF